MMIRQTYDLKNLFKQLGLASEPEAIDEFINKHKLDANVRLYQADFWNDSQRSFLEDGFYEDEMWSLVQDELNVRLRS